jgi:hypothetical protein
MEANALSHVGAPSPVFGVRWTPPESRDRTFAVSAKGGNASPLAQFKIGLKLLEIPLTRVKSATSLFLIDNFCTVFALRSPLRSAHFAMTTRDKNPWRFFAMRLAGKEFLALLLFTSYATALRAQTIQIKLVDGTTGHPVKTISWLSPRTTLHVGLGRESDLSLVLTADKQGVVPLRFTRDDSEINVPACKGKRAARDKLLKNGNKNDVKEFNEKYKNCTNFPVNNPIVGFADSISIGPVIGTLNGTTYFRYVQCWAGFPTFFSTEEVLQHGVVTANTCGKATASPEPGQIILFVRLPTNREAWRQAWN